MLISTNEGERIRRKKEKREEALINKVHKIF